MQPRLLPWAAAGLSLFLGACALRPVASLDWPPAVIELGDVPFHPQAQYQCGPAALATVLNHAGVPISPDSLVNAVYIPGRQGSFQAEMIGATRQASRLPLILQPRWSALIEALEDGWPVLVFQNEGLSWWPQWHYAVLVGVDPKRQTVILRSGTVRRYELDAQTFLKTWARAGRWALIAVPADRIPSGVESQAWLQAAVDLQSLGKLDLAEQALEAARERWPRQPLVWMLSGNLRYQQGERISAAGHFERAVALGGDAAAYNNLAAALMELQCPLQAQSVLNAVHADSVPSSMRDTLAQTRQELEQMLDNSRDGSHRNGVAADGDACRFSLSESAGPAVAP